MLFLLALLFFLLSTSVTAFPVYQYPDPLPIPPTALAFVADPVDQRDLPLRHFGCWTPIDKIFPFVFCHEHDDQQKFFGNYKGIYEKYKPSQLLLYKRVMNDNQFKNALRVGEGSRELDFFYQGSEAWRDDTLFAGMTSEHSMYMGNILINNPRSWGCWTPMPTNGQAFAVVVCLDNHNRVLEYPVGVGYKCGGMTFVRVLTEEHFTSSPWQSIFR